MIEQLTSNFSPEKEEDGFSLQIGGGGDGSRSSSSYNRYSLYGNSFRKGSSKLSHSHSTQYAFVWQTLTLWREVSNRMYKLWIMADTDLLSTSSSYRL